MGQGENAVSQNRRKYLTEFALCPCRWAAKDRFQEGEPVRAGHLVQLIPLVGWLAHPSATRYQTFAGQLTARVGWERYLPTRQPTAARPEHACEKGGRPTDRFFSIFGANLIEWLSGNCPRNCSSHSMGNNCTSRRNPKVEILKRQRNRRKPQAQRRCPQPGNSPRTVATRSRRSWSRIHPRTWVGPALAAPVLGFSDRFQEGRRRDPFVGRLSACGRNAGNGGIAEQHEEYRSARSHDRH
jgi:hypothetical protein